MISPVVMIRHLFVEKIAPTPEEFKSGFAG